jgi:hypothetical protein
LYINEALEKSMDNAFFETVQTDYKEQQEAAGT